MNRNRRNPMRAQFGRRVHQLVITVDLSGWIEQMNAATASLTALIGRHAARLSADVQRGTPDPMEEQR